MKEELSKKYGKDFPSNIDKFNIVNDKSKFVELVKIISNNKITNYDFIEENMNLEDLALRLEDCEEYYMIYFDWKEPLDTIVYCTNELLKRLDYNIKVTEEQIITKDNEFIKNRRNDNIVTTDNDLNVINEILQAQNYEFITFPIDADGYWLAIIQTNNIEEIKRLGDN